MDVAEGELIRQLLGVLMVFGLLGAAVWRLRSGPLRTPWRQARATRLETVGRVALTAQHAVHLVRIDGRELVVATHPHGCSLLGTAGEEQA
jgi:flagellar biogenesis protein FliO